MEPLMTIKEAAELLKMHPTTVYRLARRGQVPAIRIGISWRFIKEDLLAWLQEKLKGD
jgi:excisionase family DNA binding protein